MLRDFWPSMPTIINKEKNAKLNWNHEANPSVFTARNDIYALEFFMSAQCVTGWFRRSSIRLNRFRNMLYTGQWDASALLRITNLQDVNRGPWIITVRAVCGLLLWNAFNFWRWAIIIPHLTKITRCMTFCVPVQRFKSTKVMWWRHQHHM